MGNQYQVTFWISFLGLILALWLGIYLVTRNPKYAIAWLTAGTLWCMSGLFLNVLLAMDPPDVAYWPAWLQDFLPFWHKQIYSSGVTTLLQGWSIVPAIALWHHATVLLRPGKWSNWRVARILIGYAIAIIAIVVQANTPVQFAIDRSSPTFLNNVGEGSWYLIFGIAILILAVASAVNLVQTMTATSGYLPRKQVGVLVRATLITGLVGPLSLAGSIFQWPVPIIDFSLAAGLPIGIIGYGVARYSALMEGRTIRRDFFYNFALLVLIILIYLLASWTLIQFYHVPGIILVVVPMLAVITHSLMNPAYRLMDWLFFRPNARQLRSSLRHLLMLAIEGKTLEDSLADALRTICVSVQASYGLIVTFEGQSVRKAAAYRTRGNLSGLAISDLTSDDVIKLPAGKIRPLLENAALLIPLYADANQLGALILGCPVNGVQYPNEEVEHLMNHTDQIADVIYIAQLKTNYMHQIVELTEAQHHPVEDPPTLVPVEAVESALRNLYDYAFLADSPLADLELVHAQLTRGELTHLERGKILHKVLIEAMEKLCPQAASPRDPPPREWHPYLILWEAYREEKSNRDIMSHLYISEGTFNRTRRSAIRSIARALGEMEIARA